MLSPIHLLTLIFEYLFNIKEPFISAQPKKIENQDYKFQEIKTNTQDPFEEKKQY